MCDYETVFKEIAQYRNAKLKAERELERLENEIKEYMIAENITELIGEEHRALYREVVSNRFDTTRFKKAMPELAKKFTKKSSSMRFDFS